MKAIMYHYVREFSAELPYFRFLDVTNFRKQLLFFKKEYGFVERDEWLEFVCTGTMPAKQGKVLLTFDDAMSCHFNYVFPELLDNGLWGIFYVPTNPYTTGKILDVHRIHLLCGAFRGDRLLEITRSLITHDMILDRKIKAFNMNTYTEQNNDIGVTEFKRLMNYYIDYQYREGIIDAIENELEFNRTADEFYVSLKKLSDMKGEGMIIGSHTDSHPVMSKLSYKKQLVELQKSFSVLSDLTAGSPRTYCHTHGEVHDFDSNTIKALKSCDVAYSFMVDHREVLPKDFSHSKHQLPRYDCNYFKHGQIS